MFYFDRENRDNKFFQYLTIKIKYIYEIFNDREGSDH